MVITRALTILFLAALAGAQVGACPRAQGGGVQQPDKQNVMDLILDAGYTFRCLKFNGHAKTISPAYEIPACWSDTAVTEVAFSHWVGLPLDRHRESKILLPLVEPLPPPCSGLCPAIMREPNCAIYPDECPKGCPEWHPTDGMNVPFDVPAIQAEYVAWTEQGPCRQVSKAPKCQVPLSTDIECALVQCETTEHKEKRWTCANKSRVLLTDESGGRHCIWFGGTP